jgi:hypothetical protein
MKMAVSVATSAVMATIHETGRGSGGDVAVHEAVEELVLHRPGKLSAKAQHVITAQVFLEMGLPVVAFFGSSFGLDGDLNCGHLSSSCVAGLK